MVLVDRIAADLTAAMKARDTTATATLRSVVAAVRNLRVAEGHEGDVTDEEAQALIAREAKRRSEAAEAFAAAGRPDLADKERAELAVLRRYLPAELDDAELAAIVDAALAASGATDLGAAMKAVMPAVRGRADGRRVNALVRARLRL